MISISVASSLNGGNALQILERHGITGRKNCVLFLDGRATANEISLLITSFATLNDFGIGYCIDKYDNN